MQYEVYDYVTLQNIVPTLKQRPQQKHVEIITANKEFLSLLASAEKSRGTITAQNLLMYAGIKDYKEKVVLPDLYAPKSFSGK